MYLKPPTKSVTEMKEETVTDMDMEREWGKGSRAGMERAPEM